MGGQNGFVRFKDVETAEFLIDNGEGLETLGLADLFVEPCPDLILFYFWQFLVRIVDVSGQQRKMRKKVT